MPVFLFLSRSVRPSFRSPRTFAMSRIVSADPRGCGASPRRPPRARLAVVRRRTELSRSASRTSVPRPRWSASCFSPARSPICAHAWPPGRSTCDACCSSCPALRPPCAASVVAAGRSASPRASPERGSVMLVDGVATFVALTALLLGRPRVGPPMTAGIGGRWPMAARSGAAGVRLRAVGQAHPAPSSRLAQNTPR